MTKTTLWIITLLATLIGATALPLEAKPPTSKSNDVYTRVMEAQAIRCGYFIEPPFTMQDPNTGEFSGISVDLINAVAKELNLKIEWVEEISFATFPQDLKNKRYDMVCGSVFIMPRAGQMDYSKPYTHVPINGYVRADDTRFDQPINGISWDNVKISGLDGEGATAAVTKMLPQAQLSILPQLSNISEMLLTVETGKADIGFVLPSVYADYNKNNPEKLRPAKMDKPLYTYAVSFGIARDQHTFKAMINNMIEQLGVSGELETILDKHDGDKNFTRL